MSAVVLAVGILTVCGDPAGPGAESRLALTVDVPAGDSVAQLGVVVDVAMRDSARFRELRVWVDSSAAPAPQRTETVPWETSRWAVVAYVPGSGRHTITVAATDTVGRTVSASVTRTFRLPGVPYTVAVLPDLGHGGAATFVHANGATAGWVATAEGRRRPAVWRNGVLEVVPAPDSGDVVAVRVNAAGDVLLRFGGSGYVPPGPNVRVRRADGAVLTVGPLYYDGPEVPPSARPAAVCCSVAADLNDQRQALGTAIADGLLGRDAAVLDVASGRLTDSLHVTPIALNDRGHMLGTAQYTRGSGAYALGFTIPPLPGGPQGVGCLTPSNYRGTPYEQAVDLDDADNALTLYCDNATLRSPAGSVWLDRYLGRVRQAHLSRTGGVVVGLDSTGALVRWSLATGRAEQVRVSGGSWRVATVGAVNAGGAIAGQGIDASGRAAALLLTPAAP